MNAQEKAQVLALGAASPVSAQEVLRSLGITTATYYRWRRRLKEGGDRLKDLPGGPRRACNRLRPEEEEAILRLAQEHPVLSPRELAWTITDQGRFSVSESTVYRVLKRAGLMKPAQVVGFAAGKEYHHKSSRPNQMWVTDGAYLKVVGWGWCSLLAVLDDYSRYILAWRLQTDVTAASLIEVVQEAVDLTGMTEVPVVGRTALLTGHGSGYLSRAFTDYLGLVGLRHIVASPYHPQTSGKCERYHRPVKGRVRLVSCTAPNTLREAVAGFLDFYNHHRYHKALRNLTPADVYHGRREEILQRRKEAKQRTIEERRRFNQCPQRARTVHLSVRKRPENSHFR
jgi:putative transposase